MSDCALFEEMLLGLSANRPAEDFIHTTWQRGLRCPARGSAHTHVAEGHELAFVTEGRAEVLLPTGVVEMSPGRLLLVPRGVEHAESPGAVPEPYAICWCCTDHRYARIDQTSFIPGTGRRIGPSVDLIGRTHVESIAAAIISELENREWRWEQSVSGLLKHLATILIRRLRRESKARLHSGESPAIYGDSHTWRVVQAALRYCEASTGRPPRLADVAAAVGYSPSHLSRLVSSHLGHSLSDHIRDIRIATSKRLLETTDMLICDIAREVGYQDPSDFSNAFKHAEGISPSGYREHLEGI
ncbi:MAG: AraC family transcriptional regulator [Planctomycetota bacterium]